MSEIWNLNNEKKKETTKPIQTLKSPPLREGPNDSQILWTSITTDTGMYFSQFSKACKHHVAKKAQKGAKLKWSAICTHLYSVVVHLSRQAIILIIISLQSDKDSIELPAALTSRCQPRFWGHWIEVARCFRGVYSSTLKQFLDEIPNRYLQKLCILCFVFQEEALV